MGWRLKGWRWVTAWNKRNYQLLSWSHFALHYQGSAVCFTRSSVDVFILFSVVFSVCVVAYTPHRARNISLSRVSSSLLKEVFVKRHVSHPEGSPTALAADVTAARDLLLNLGPLTSTTLQQQHVFSQILCTNTECCISVEDRR